jgi:hypothetical protein
LTRRHIPAIPAGEVAVELNDIGELALGFTDSVAVGCARPAMTHPDGQFMSKLVKRNVQQFQNYQIIIEFSAT